MVVVSDTSPILNLAIVSRLELLHTQFGAVVIPSVVQDELQVDSELPGASKIRAALQAGWIEVAQPTNTALAQTLGLELDEGEAAAIALALEVKADLILMDESEGRAKAAALGLRPVGVLGVLIRAKHEGQIDSLKETMIRLREEAGFFISDTLFSTVLREVAES